MIILNGQCCQKAEKAKYTQKKNEAIDKETRKQQHMHELRQRQRFVCNKNQASTPNDSTPEHIQHTIREQINEHKPAGAAVFRILKAASIGIDSTFHT